PKDSSRPHGGPSLYRWVCPPTSPTTSSSRPIRPFSWASATASTRSSSAVRERPDLAAERAQVAAARARVSIARSQALPSLSVGGNAGETHFVNNPSLPTFGNSYTATLTLSIPLFSGGAQIYNVKAAAAAAAA